VAWWNRRRPPARTAAVQPIGNDWTRIVSRTRQPWQERARFFTENLGLVRFANGLTSQTAARCDLRIEKLVDPVRREWEPADGEPIVTDVLETYQGPDSDSPSDLVARHVWHYQGVGEAYMVVDQDPSSGELTWSIRSTRAVQFRSGTALVMDLPGGSVRDGSARELPVEQVRRLWVPNDEWTLRAKSPMEGVLADCERYWSLARRIRREAESVLTNGLLFTPEYAHTYPPSRTPGERQASRLDQDFYAVAQAAFTDDDSVQAIAPLSMHYGQKDVTQQPLPPQFVYPGMDLSGKGIEYRAEAVESIARGLDLPMSLLTEGPGGGNHWSAWLVDEKFFTTHLGPLMDRVCHTDLTIGFFRPVLAELARVGRWQGDPSMYRVGYDPAPVIVHPDRAAASVSLYGQGLLKGVVVCEANGFEGSDMPDAAELAQILDTMRAIKGPATPAGVPAPPGDNLLAAGPGRRELPPAPAMASLAPYPSEVTAWLD
jgi:hypothetical protein